MAQQTVGSSRFTLASELCEALKSHATFRNVAAEFMRAAREPTPGADTHVDLSLRLHTLIEDLAREIDAGTADREPLLQFLNAEYTLSAINSSVELPLNAYLIHWLECVASWEKRLDQMASGSGRGKTSQAQADEQQAGLVVRLELVKRLLMGASSLQSLGDTTAEAFAQRTPPPGPYIRFDVDMWIKESIGRQSIIWEDDNAMSTFRDMITSVCPPERPIERPLDLAGLQRRDAAEVYALLRQSPDAVRSAILRMPFDEIQTFDVFNRLLGFELDRPLSVANTDPQQLIRDFLQCALNNLERLSEATEQVALPLPSESDHAAHSLHVLAAATSRTNTEVRVQEARAAQLIVMFIKGLFRSRRAVWSDIEWQLKELTARYSWVKEVKELPRVE